MNPILNIRSLRYDEPRHVPALLTELYGCEGWVYIGRKNVRYGLVQSPLANPYTHLPYANGLQVPSRVVAVAQYRVWLWHQIRAETPEVVSALSAIQPNTVLVCWCHPLLCHAEVVAKATAWRQFHMAVASS